MEKSTLDQIGARIRAARQVKGLGVGQLAEMVGISKGYISQLENGNEGVNPTLDVLKRIADALDVTIADLVGAPKAQGKLPLPSRLPKGLQELVAELRARGEPLDDSTVLWLANANYRGRRPTTKEDFRLLLYVLRGSSGAD